MSELPEEKCERSDENGDDAFAREIAHLFLMADAAGFIPHLNSLLRYT